MFRAPSCLTSKALLLRNLFLLQACERAKAIPTCQDRKRDQGAVAFLDVRLRRHQRNRALNLLAEKVDNDEIDKGEVTVKIIGR